MIEFFVLLFIVGVGFNDVGYINLEFDVVLVVVEVVFMLIEFYELVNDV